LLRFCRRDIYSIRAQFKMKKRVSLYFINGFGPCSLRHLFLRVTGASLFIYFISIPGRKSFADQISRCKGNKRIPSFSVAHRSANAHRRDSIIAATGFSQEVNEQSSGIYREANDPLQPLSF